MAETIQVRRQDAECGGDPMQLVYGRHDADAVFAECFKCRKLVHWNKRRGDADTWQNGWVDPRTVEYIWKERFEYFYENYDEFVFPMTLHPDTAG